ncbi:MAG: glutathione S-transferase N-terminal domain-containing protein [Candidatus Sungbacteria bacterium]|nr:glutathione S-transferase N-terminal domain-containing protein [Candidatus Sungbacteria bacterium]
MDPVTIYSTPTCGYCKVAKQYFTEKGVPYVEKDVSLDALALQEMLAKTQQMGVPVIDINGQAIVGFNKPAIDRMLGLA